MEIDYRDGYLELLVERSSLKATNKELLAVLEEIMKYQVRNDWMDLPIWVRAKEAIARAVGGA